MSLLQSIVTGLPGLGHYAYCELSTDTAPLANGQVPWDVSTVVGTSITVDTSAGVTKGRFTLVQAGLYLICGFVTSTFSSTANSYVLSQGSGASLGNIYPFGNQQLSAQMPVSFHVFNTGGSGTVNLTYTFNTGAASTADTLLSSYCWALAWRLS